MASSSHLPFRIVRENMLEIKDDVPPAAGCSGQFFGLWIHQVCLSRGNLQVRSGRSTLAAALRYRQAWALRPGWRVQLPRICRESTRVLRCCRR